MLVLSWVVASALGITLGTAPGCSTAVAAGLTTQLIAELNALGTSFSPLDDTARFICTAPCVPALQTAARDSLASATASVGDFITLNSAYRSSAQQYLLYTWWLNGQCDIPLADPPGTSRHEGGLAVDTNFYDFWNSVLPSYGWVWAGSADVFHFRYAGAGAMEGVSAQSLLAFQRLWNRNNPSDPITEDGVYGENTAARLYNAPVDGW